MKILWYRTTILLISQEGYVLDEGTMESQIAAEILAFICHRNYLKAIQVDQRFYVMKMDRVVVRFYLVDIPVKYIREFTKGDSKTPAFFDRSCEEFDLFSPESRAEIMRSLLTIKDLLLI
jgi:hypothetical protein